MQPGAIASQTTRRSFPTLVSGVVDRRNSSQSSNIGACASIAAPSQPLSAYSSASLAEFEIDSAQSSLPETWGRELDDDHLHEDLQQRINPPKERLVHRLRLSKLRSRRNESWRAARRSMALRQDNDRVADIQPGKFLNREQQERLCSIWQEWRRVEEAQSRMPDITYNSREEFQAVWAATAGITPAELASIQIEGPHAGVLILSSVERLLRVESQKCLFQGMDLEDVLAEARGLWLDAAALCDFSRSNLNSFGTMFLRQRLRRIVDRDGSLLDRPAVALYDSLALERHTKALEDRLGRKPTVKEVAKESNFSQKKVANVRRNRRFSSSIDAPAPRSEDEATVGETIADEESMVSDRNMDRVVKREMEEGIEGVLSKCVKDPGTRDMFLHYYGFGGREVATLQQLGKKHGLSHETVRLRMFKARKAIQEESEVMEQLKSFRHERLTRDERQLARGGTPGRTNS